MVSVYYMKWIFSHVLSRKQFIIWMSLSLFQFCDSVTGKERENEQGGIICLTAGPGTFLLQNKSPHSREMLRSQTSEGSFCTGSAGDMEEASLWSYLVCTFTWSSALKYKYIQTIDWIVPLLIWGLQGSQHVLLNTRSKQWTQTMPTLKTNTPEVFAEIWEVLRYQLPTARYKWLHLKNDNGKVWSIQDRNKSW